MISNIFDFEKSNLSFISAFNLLKLDSILKSANITKSKGYNVKDIFLFLFTLAFTNKSLYRHLKSNPIVDDNTCYRFLNEDSFNWRKFLNLLSFKVISLFCNLTSHHRVKVFILDDTVLEKSRSKKAEFLAKVYDHVNNRYVKGYTLLTLAHSDGFTTVPLDFALLSSANSKNRYNEMYDVKKNTVNYHRRLEAIKQKPQLCKELIKRAIENGVVADYVLCDSWFINEPFIQDMLSLDMHTIGMVKQLKQRYSYEDGCYTLNQLLRISKKQNNSSNIQSSIIVKTKEGIEVKLVFVKNKNNKKQYLTLLCTDITVDEKEIVRIYGNRWSIETMFKVSKSFLKLNKEYKAVSIDMMISHISIVFARYIILEYQKRIHSDYRYTVDELYYNIFDEVSDMKFIPALNALSLLFDTIIKKYNIKDDFIKCQVSYFISLLPSYFNMFDAIFSWES